MVPDTEQNILVRTERMDVMISRLDASIDKLTEISQTISKLLAVHDTKFEQQDKINTYFQSEADKLKHQIDANFESTQNNFKIVTVNTGIIQRLQKDIETINNILKEIDAVHEARWQTALDKKTNNLESKLTELEKSIQHILERCDAENITVNEKFSQFNKILFTIVGGAIVIVFLVNDLGPFVLSLFK
jgi:hypothetical protein